MAPLTSSSAGFQLRFARRGCPSTKPSSGGRPTGSVWVGAPLSAGRGSWITCDSQLQLQLGTALQLHQCIRASVYLPASSLWYTQGVSYKPSTAPAILVGPLQRSQSSGLLQDITNHRAVVTITPSSPSSPSLAAAIDIALSQPHSLQGGTGLCRFLPETTHHNFLQLG